MRPKLHIVGTHGVPARYGGFETLADFLCQHLSNEYDITVYCNAFKYPDRCPSYCGATLKYIKLEANGFPGIFYDLLSYIMALREADVILYLSPVGSGFMTPLRYFTGTPVLVNHGGLNEWEREKLSALQKVWAKFNHRIAARFATANIADNSLYQESLRKNFGASSVIIRYGGDHVNQLARDHAHFRERYPFVSKRYAVSVSRAQLDNNIHLVLEAFDGLPDWMLVVVSNWDVSSYGRDLRDKYRNRDNIVLLDAIYDKDELDFIRGNAALYIHSHSRCGTAPSLVEAMSLGQAIVSFDVPTNRETTSNKAVFFQDPETLRNIMQSLTLQQISENRTIMRALAAKHYQWKLIAKQYNDLLRNPRAQTAGVL